MYQRQGKSAFKKDLNNIIAFCAHLGNPEKKFKSIHVAGTNGKGSTSHMLAAMLQNTGLKVGLYTSPHLKDFRERIRISGEPISEIEVTSFIDAHNSFVADVQPSFFEMTVAMAFEHFSINQVDIAVIEVGLGGRLDSTNVIDPELSVITNIGYDHMDMLGDTLSLIAEEKAGVIKKNVPVIIGEYHNETAPVFKSKAREKKAPIKFAEMCIETSVEEVVTDLKGVYQKRNLVTAIAAIEELNTINDWEINIKKALKGLSNVAKLTGLKGRWQELSNEPLIICDTGHNSEAFDYILPTLEELDKNDLWMVMGFVNDKNVSDLLARLPQDAKYVFTQAKIPRAMPIEQLEVLVSETSLSAVFIKDVNDAIAHAKDNADKADVIFIGGSTFVVAEINEL